MKAPLAMPVRGAAKQQFEIQRVDFLSPEASGRIGGVQAGFPLWAGTWTLTDMLPAKSDEWRAFISQLRGATRRFLGRDRQRPYPRAYRSGFSGMTRAGGGSFDGTATSWSQSVNSDGDQLVTINGLPASFVLNTGDYVGYSWTATDAEVAGLTWYALVRAVETKTANGSGVISNITVEPPVPSAVPGSATLTLDNPKCVMVIVADQSNLEAIDHRGAIRGGQISGVQDIRG
jgi:hypothetical protein